MAEWAELIDAVSDFVVLQKELGQHDVVLSAEAVQFLRSGGAKRPAVASAAAPVKPIVEPIVASVSTSVASAGESADADDFEAAVAMPAQGRDLEKLLGECVRCESHVMRRGVLLGRGCVSRPEVLFLADMPEEGDAERGAFFSGVYGAFLDKVIGAMGLSADEVYLTGVCKCRVPSGARVSQISAGACLEYLREQLKVLQPKVMVVLGSVTLRALFQGRQVSAEMLGKWMQFEGVSVMPTFHPERMALHPETSVETKKKFWANMKQVLARLERQAPKRG